MIKGGDGRLWRRLYLLPICAWALSGLLLIFADRALERPLRLQREADFRAEVERTADAMNRADGEAGPMLEALFRVRPPWDRLVADDGEAHVRIDTDRDSSLWLAEPSDLGRGVRRWGVDAPPRSPWSPRDAPTLYTLTALDAESPLRIVWSRRAPGISGYATPLRRGLFAAWLGFGLLLVTTGYRGVKRMQAAVGALSRLVREEQTLPEGPPAVSRGGAPASTRDEDAFDLAHNLERIRRHWDKEAAQYRREERERTSIFEGMPEGLIAVDGSRRLLLVNRAAARLLSISEPAPIGARLTEVVRLSDLHRYVEERLAGRGPVALDLDAEGGRRILEVRGTLLTEAAGRPRGLVMVVTDVTDVRRLEQIRKDFVDNVSHELKTPLTNLRGYVETLLDGAEDDPAMRVPFLRTIHRNAERMHRIVEDLLNLSRIESQGRQIERQPIRLGELLARVLEETRAEAEAQKVRLWIEEETGDACFHGNLFMLERALANLVDNAIKYGGQGKDVRLRSRRAGDRLRLEVVDQGAGIAGAHLGRLFERFYRVDRGRSRELGGTGLGLAIVKHVALAHGGEALVESEPGRGSTFTLSLPWDEG